jgi:hypothetical protein
MNPDKIKILATIQRICEVGIKSSKLNSGREWLKEQKLSFEATGAVFNSGQISQHKTQPFLDDLVTAGFITPSTYPANATRTKAYTVFAKYSVMFPLKDAEGNVVNYYAVRLNNRQAYYLNNEGVYPCYPPANTKTLFIVPSVLDGATLLETKALGNREAVIALHDGEISEIHINAIQELKHLKEIIVIDN